jgi:dTDP-L-rhamnose 4-epimerase
MNDASSSVPSLRVLITGGVGFIGTTLARRLVADGHEVFALDALLEQVHLDPALSVREFPGRVVHGDVCDPQAWAAFDDTDISVVVHLAAETGVGQSMYESERYHRVNVEGTAIAGDVALRRSVPIISLSSRAVYGEGAYSCVHHGTVYGASCCESAAPTPSRESDPHRPISVYGQTKSEAEQRLLGRHAADIPVTVIRPQNVVGPGQSLHNPYTGVLAAFLARLRAGLGLQVFGDGLATRDFIHVEDLAALLHWAILTPPPQGDPRILNAGTGIRTSLIELAQYALDAASRDHDLIEFVDIHRSGDIAHACADLSRLTEVGAPLPVHDTSGAVSDFIRWGWDRPGAPVESWTRAIDELSDRGLLS